MTSSAAAAVRVEAVRTLDGLLPHAAEWDDLAAALPQVMPMLSHAWVATFFAQELSPDERLLVLLARDGEQGTLLGVLPVVLAGRRARVPLAYVTEDGDLLLRPGRERDTLAALLAGLADAAPGLLGLALDAVRDDSPTLRGIADGIAGWSVSVEIDTYGSSLPIEGDADAWEASLPKGLRKDLRAGESRARREGNPVRTTCLEGPEAAPEHLDALVRLEASGWKGREGTAIASRNQSREKYRALAEHFHDQGRLEWHHLHLGDRLAAARMAVRYDHGLMLLRSAYDEAFGKHHVGHLSFRALVLREHARGAGGEVNIVTDWPWCRRWNMVRRPYRRVLLAPRRPFPLLVTTFPAALRRAGRRVPGLRALKHRLDRRGKGRRDKP